MEIKGKGLSGFFGFLMVYSLNLLILNSLYFEMPLFKILIINIILWTLIFTIVIYNRYFIKIRLLFLWVSGFFVFSLLPERLLKIAFLTKQDILSILKTTSRLINAPEIMRFVIWSGKYMCGFTTDIPKGFDIILSIIIFIIVAIVFASLIIKKRRFLYFIIPIALFIFEWFRYVEGITGLFNIYAAGLMAYYIFINYNNNVAQINRKNSSFKYYDHKSIMCFAGIIIIMIIFTSNVIINTLSLGMINDKMSNMFPSILELRSEYKRAKHSKFTFSKTPYQPNGNRLGGSINNKDMLVMKVDSNRPSLYLRGRIKNIYTGYSWYSDNNSFHKNRNRALSIDKVEFKDKDEATEVTIYPHNILTSTVFTPYFPIEIESKNRKIKYNSDLEMYFVRSFFKGTKGSYTIKSILPINKSGEGNIIDDRETQKHKYLKLTEKLPLRVSKLAKDLTKNYPDDYSKIKTLEKYLANNYTYSLIVPDVPKNVDFVDYFLFEEKTGYCTYYASSLAIMGRAIGIPTRYVEGFILPKEKGESGLYEVKAENAHAWVEAYIDGMGWITLEPTAAYYTQEIEEEVEEMLLEEISTENNDLTEKRNDDFRRLRAEEEMNFVEGDFNFAYNKRDIPIYQIVLLFVFIIIVLRIIYLYYRKRKFFSKTDYRKYIIKNYYIIISLYSFIERIDLEKYSPFQLMNIIDKKLMEIDVTDDIIDSINKAFYSNENINEEDINYIDNLRDQVEDVVIHRIGKLAYFYHKHVLGDIIYRKGGIYGTLRKNTPS